MYSRTAILLFFPMLQAACRATVHPGGFQPPVRLCLS